MFWRWVRAIKARVSMNFRQYYGGRAALPATLWVQCQNRGTGGWAVNQQIARTNGKDMGSIRQDYGFCHSGLRLDTESERHSMASISDLAIGIAWVQASNQLITMLGAATSGRRRSQTPVCETSSFKLQPCPNR